MNDLSFYKKDYKENGYFVYRNYLNQNLIKKINDYLDSSNHKMSIPFSDEVPWGYGNLIQDQLFMDWFPIDTIKKSIRDYIDLKELKFNHILAVNKAPFIGPDVEWHQEFFNINTFAPGYNPFKDLNKFMQIFVALDEHTNENGPLMVFEGSHKEGLLPSEDIVNNNLVHKRRLPYKELKRISENYSLKSVILKPGDAIFFNHLLVHGSPTNCSQLRRRALLIQVRSSDKSKDNNLYEKEVKYRSSFLIKNFQQKIDKLVKDNPYKDMK